MKILVSIMILALLLTQPLLANETTKITTLMRNKIEDVIKLIERKDIDKPTRNKKIIAVLGPVLDFNFMAKLSLGKKYWKRMNKEQQKQFILLFTNRLQESYLEKLDLYTDEVVEIKEAVQKKNRIIVKTFLVSKDDKKEMKYKFYKKRNKWKVYDVEILGVSVVQTYRSQFDGILRKGSIDNLLKKLKVSGEFKISNKGN